VPAQYERPPIKSLAQVPFRGASVRGGLLIQITEVRVLTGIDDHTKFCVCVRIVAGATALKRRVSRYGLFDAWCFRC
jgi:hypothetical protein